MIHLALLVAALCALCCGLAQAKSYQTQQQAIATAFPSQKIERRTLFLTTTQAARIETLARTKVDSRIVPYYVSRDATGVTGIAFFDRALMRTMPATYMVAVKPSGEIDRVEILSFGEPDDYLPPPRWLKLYRRRVLNDGLAIGRDIPHITGASLTSRALNDGVRKALATFEVGLKGTL